MEINKALPIVILIATFAIGSCQAGGSLVGGVFSNAIGQSVDEADQREAKQAFTIASRAPVGQTIYWTNTRTGNWGYYCREFESKAHINGRAERIYGTACRHPNGTWMAI